MRKTNYSENGYYVDGKEVAKIFHPLLNQIVCFGSAIEYLGEIEEVLEAYEISGVEQLEDILSEFSKYDEWRKVAGFKCADELIDNFNK